jgi:hypothetical protein
MGKFRSNQSGFGAVEVLLALIFVAIVGFIGVYVAHNHSGAKTATLTNASKTTTPTATPTPHTSADAVSFVQKTYSDYLTVVGNVSSSNTQPVGLVGLAAVKANLSTSFYDQAAASHNGGAFSCAPQFLPNSYTASLGSSTGTTTTVGLAIANSSDGSSTTTGMTATVDLATLKITAVSCPN